MYLLSLLKQETIGIIFNWNISTTHPSPNRRTPPPKQKKCGMTIGMTVYYNVSPNFIYPEIPKIIVVVRL